MSLAAKIREQLISSFRIELAEHLQTLTDGLLALEQDTVAGKERQATLENIFRAAHSLKGASRAVGVTMVEQLAHALESTLDAMQCDTIEPTSELFTACYQALDAIQAVQTAYETGEITPPPQALQALADLESLRSRPQAAPATAKAGAESEPAAAPAAPPVPKEPPATEPAKTAPTAAPTKPPPPGDTMPTPATTTTPTPAAAGGDETIRVSVSKLDALMAQLSELLVTKIRAEQWLTQVQQYQEFITLWQKDWLSVRSAYGRLIRQGIGSNGHNQSEKDMASLLNYIGTNQERLREMNTLVSELSRQYANDMMHMSLVIDELEEEIKRVRMLPLTTITGTFGRMVRDLAQEEGKDTVLQIIGGDTELDKRVLEQIKDPLIHLLRNAVDHGIESPAQREAMSKPRRGTITLTAEQLGQDVVISISDDGAGLDIKAIRRTVARQARIDEQTLSEDDLKEAIFNAGVSTSPIITDISGRGVGLDVVRRNVEALHGRVDVNWTPGAGSVFTLTLPLRLTSSRGLLVRVSNELFAIPLNTIERITYISPEEISPLEGQDTVLCNGRPITLVRLNDVLGLPRVKVQRDETRIQAVILAASERRMAFAVDELAGEQEVVIKGLGKQLLRVGGIAGATVMGTGEVVLILNPTDLIKLAMRGERRSVLDTLAEMQAPEVARAQRRILIVDDSITTRTLEKNILEAAGYSVQLAIDGQEALNTIAVDGVPDLIVSDVAMPRLDGFDLTRRVKDDPHTAHVPVILVTSLDSPEDKAQGIEAGADAYIAKSSFDQTNLLETIEQLI